MRAVPSDFQSPTIDSRAQSDERRSGDVLSPGFVALLELCGAPIRASDRSMLGRRRRVAAARGGIDAEVVYRPADLPGSVI